MTVPWEQIATNITQGFLSSILASSAYDVIRTTIARPRSTDDFKRASEKIKHMTDLHEAVQRASQNLAMGLSRHSTTIEDDIQRLLVSPDMREFITDMMRALTLTKLDAQGRAPAFRDIEPHLRALLTEYLTLYLGGKAGAGTKLDQRFFDDMLDVCKIAVEEYVTQIIEDQNPCYYEFAIRTLVYEHRCQKRKLQLLKLHPSLEPAHLESLAAALRTGAREYYGNIEINSVLSPRLVKLSEIYVAPNLLAAESQSDGSYLLNLNEFVRRMHRVFLLGEPGGGKTTCAYKLCAEAAESFARTPELTVIPIILPLLECSDRLIGDQRAVLKEIHAQINATLEASSTEEEIEYFSHCGRILVVFEGLDEVPRRQRIEVFKRIRQFATVYPRVRIVVTHRSAGTEELTFERSGFVEIQLGSHDDVRIREYLGKAFRIHALHGRPAHIESDIKRFMKLTQGAKDLRRNPLMLELMCYIYSKKRAIPDTRAEIYRNCSEVMIEKWHERLGISLDKEVSERLDPMLEGLARWMREDEKKRSSGVTKEEMTDRITDLLIPNFEPNLKRARKLASKITTWFTGRAWVFTPRHTNTIGEKLYQFTHETFYEYYLARSMVVTHQEPCTFVEAFLEEIVDGDPSIVAELAFQIFVEGPRRYSLADRLVKELLGVAEESDTREQGNILLFLCRCLRSIAPTALICREAAGRVFDYAHEWRLATDNDVAPAPLSLFSVLFRPRADLQEHVIAGTSERILERTCETDEKRAVRAIEVWLTSLLSGHDALGAKAVRDGINMELKALTTRIEEFATDSELIAGIACSSLGKSVSSAIDVHGPGVLFRASISPLQHHKCLRPMSWSLILSWLAGDPPSYRVQQLVEVGTYYLQQGDTLVPIDAFGAESGFRRPHLADYLMPRLQHGLTRDGEIVEADLGGFLLMACEVEASPDSSNWDRLFSSGWPSYFDWVRELLACRYDVSREPSKKAVEELVAARFSEGQQLVVDWVLRKKDCVEAPTQM